jgi:hypothetical protein
MTLMGVFSRFLLVALFATGGCAAAGGIDEPRQEVIKDRAAWEKFWREHNLKQLVEGALPQIDFSKELLVVAAMGQKRTGGYAIEIVKAEVTGNRLRIHVKHTTPAPGSMNIQALTAPFHIVAIPRTDATPEFVK